MRDTVASHYGGHAFEKRFLDMDFLQLRILYEQVMRNKQKEYDDKFELIKTLNDFWVENFNVHFENLLMFTNPKAYKLVQEMKDIKVLQSEIKEEEFPEMWDDLMKILPQECIVSDIEEDPNAGLTPISPELEDVFGKWESQGKFSGLGSYLEKQNELNSKEESISGWDTQSVSEFTPINNEEG